MPNIEMHGTRREKNLDQHTLVFKQFKGVEYRDGIVLTMANDYVYDPQGVPRPFLRVIFTDAEQGTHVFHDCLERLARLNMDIEVLVIHDFIRKKG
ncbi:MAG: hypothetical protein AAB794_02450 [Patescibacteria group bacterium]